MCDPKDAAPIGELLESDSFAGVAKAVQVVMGDQLHVFYFLIVGRHRASLRRGKTVPVVLNVPNVQAIRIRNSKHEIRNKPKPK
jgi:hypothetical protein